VEVTASDEHSSLHRYGMNYEYRKFYETGPSQMHKIIFKTICSKLDCLKINDLVGIGLLVLNFIGPV
jgi:hypothetical protein